LEIPVIIKNQVSPQALRTYKGESANRSQVDKNIKRDFQIQKKHLFLDILSTSIDTLYQHVEMHSMGVF
jgi:hypothetical protein